MEGGSPDDVDQVGICDMGRGFNGVAYRLRLEALERALLQAGVRPRGARVFEAAYGVGFYLRFWQRQDAAAVAGVDLSPRARENAARQFPGYDLRAGDLARIHEWDDWAPLEGSFDVVTAIDVLYHLVRDEAAGRAVRNLGRLVRPGGVLVFTDKPVGLHAPYAECDIVTRRPLEWYDRVLAPAGLVRERVAPVFWCMDPPAHHARSLSGRMAYLGWGTMRAATKFWPRNSPVQVGIGRAVGTVGALVDRAVLPRLSGMPNLAIATYRRPAAE